MTDSEDTHEFTERIATSVKEQINEVGSRRRFLRRSALAGGTLLALGGGTGFTLAQENGGTSPGEMGASFDDVGGSDLDVLSYALTLETLENAFYREGLEMFDREDFQNAGVVQNHSTEAGTSVYTLLETIGEHEAAHVDVLSQAITLLGGDPSPEASYDFGIESVADFVGLAKVFENTGVSAYAGAAPYIQSPDLQSAALSIHSVEARHAAFLNDLNGEPFFPNAFDPASSQEEVPNAVGPFIE